MAQKPFTLGNHTFITSDQNGPMSRFDVKKRTPISGAAPPGFLTGHCRPATSTKAAKNLLKGNFCGHGEPTFTVFEVVIGGAEKLELAAIMPSEDSETPDPELLMARKLGADGPWLVLFDQNWADDSGSFRLPSTTVWRTVSDEEHEELDDDGAIVEGQLAIGFEYPCDAAAVDDVSWITVDVWPDGHKGEPIVVVDCEAA